MTELRDQDLGPMPAEAAGGIYVAALKPCADRIGALLFLIATLPLSLLAAFCILTDSRGGVFFVQERVGLLGRPFRMVKFRTMVPGAQEMGTGLLVTRGDSRVTRIGRLLRATSLDELPQLWNVLVGDMSLVGPRPTLAEQVRRYDDFQRQRLRLLPGLTGLAQVSGRKALSWEERIRLDVKYLETISAWTDLKILVRTILVVLGAKDPEAREDYWRVREEKRAASDTGSSAEPGREENREVRESP